MPTLAITKNYGANQVLTKAHLDSICSSIETFINTTKLDGDNISLAAIADDLAAEISSTGADDIAGAMSATGANAVATSMTSTGANAIAADMTSTGANAVAASRTRATGTSVAAGGVAISSSTGLFSSGSTSFVDVTNLSVTIVTSGRPVRLQLISDASGEQSVIRAEADNAEEPAAVIMNFLRGATSLGVLRAAAEVNNTISATPATDWPPSAFQDLDAPAAGTYTYKLQARCETSGHTMEFNYVKLVAYEL